MRPRACLGKCSFEEGEKKVGKPQLDGVQRNCSELKVELSSVHTDLPVSCGNGTMLEEAAAQRYSDGYIIRG